VKIKTADITAGEFRFLVTVQRPTNSPDGSGGFDVVWNDVATFYAQITNEQGSETYGDGPTGRVRTFQRFSFSTWWRTDIQQTDRLSFQGNLFNIRAINNIELRNKFLQIVAESGVEQ
jgi:SPP1 family predicted phage head-tail adaptor